MSVTEVLEEVAKFTPEERAEFDHWYYIYKEVQAGIAEADRGEMVQLDLDDLKAELNRRLEAKAKQNA